MATGALLEVEDLDVRYGGIAAVAGVDLAVPEATVVALLGPNGAGKTSILRAISGLLVPEGGSIRLGGLEITGRRANAVARLGVGQVPEGRGIFPGLSVRDNLKLAYQPGQGSDSVEEGLTLFPELAERLEQRAGTLSGGQQQMVALARTLVARPRLLLLDEISTGLAPMVVRRLLGAVGEAAAAGTAVLLVEQYVDAALDMADYAYVLEGGRLVDAGEASDIRASGLRGTYLGADEEVAVGS